MKKRKSNTSELNRRFSFASLAAVLVCVAVFALVQAVLIDDIYLAVVKHEMKTTAEKIAVMDFEKDDYKKILADIEASDNQYIEIYYPRDTLIYTTESNVYAYGTTDGAEQYTVSLKPRIMKIIERTENPDGSYYEVRQEYVVSAQHIVYGCFIGDDIAVELYYPVELIRDNSEIASTILFCLCIIVIVIILTVSVHIASTIFLPLQTIIENTKKMANLDFSARCPPYKIKDLNELSASVNFLSSSLSKALDDLQNENRQLETDILYERRQEKVRKSFISNVSHELKTPIAIIKGYAEGMKIGVGCDSTEEFCDIIIDEADKMNNLIVRLMEYMKLSSGAYKIYSSVFNLRLAIEEFSESLSGKMKKQGITFVSEIDESFVCYSDVIMIENIFLNYLSNAISHSDYEKIIRVTAEDMGKNYRVRVFNTGKPIPGTDIENIWQSFYRADKSHSREEGRFGLGLSFVSTIQEMTGEKFGVENKTDGVEFWFDVKKKI